MTTRISVKDLVTFVYQSGDLASQTKLKNARAIGQAYHQAHQATYQETDEKEVFIELKQDSELGALHLSGRIDGVLNRDNTIIIEEIKSTDTDLSLIKEDTFKAHMMQARVYAYMYVLKHNLKSITVWLTYIHHPTKRQKTFKKRLRLDHLKQSFDTTLKQYYHWLNLTKEHAFNRKKSLEGLTFPFNHFREGQYHFMGKVYQTMITKDILFATAPTGIGKTIGALFSSLKTIKDDQEKLFYLTAKNQGKTIAVETVELLKAHGLKIKAITLNSKENMCLREEVDCDPEICPYAKGFYNRLNDALEDIFVHDDVYDAELIKKYGEYHTICPHEFALEISNHSDVIICDYNYVFDPRIKLIRYFEDTYYKPKLLIDEAHNLVDRARSMYSAELSLKSIETIKNLKETFKPSFKRAINLLYDTCLFLNDQNNLEKLRFTVDNTIPAELLNNVHYTMTKLDAWLEANKKHAMRKTLREFYFTLAQFLRISDYYSEAFRFTMTKTHDDCIYTIQCLDASKPLTEIIKARSEGTVLFSATLNPIDYYNNLLTQKEGVYFEVPSPFDPKRLGLFIDVSTSTKYHDRNQSITRIVDTIYAMLEAKQGNYIVFFPSYKYMNMVLEQFDDTGYTKMVQDRNMTYFDRINFLETFKAPSEQSKILFSVLGGSFSEGIDYVGDMLSGVLVIGVALPQFNKMNDVLKDYYYDLGYDGFDYAYTYPGINKVIQAVGRVIRRKEDKGIAILIDTRYNLAKYQTLFPSHWQPKTLYENDYIHDHLISFWSQFNDDNKE
ncbi:MAG: helicase C-terminal domain-containing protein [Bacillota bacterium]